MMQNRERTSRRRGRKPNNQADTSSVRLNACELPSSSMEATDTETVAFVFSVQTAPTSLRGQNRLPMNREVGNDDEEFDADRPSTSNGLVSMKDNLSSSAETTRTHSECSLTSETSAVADRLDFLQRHVYYNDLIMRNIVGNVVNMHDRVTLEMCSRRLLHLSRTSPWMFTSRGNHFSMTYKTMNAHISVELGDVWFAVPSTTLETRRDLSEEQIQKQHERLMTTLNGMAERFSKGIHTITIGGSDDGYREWGVRNHQLIITEGLLRFINERLVNVRTVTFRECGFDSSAVEYLCSDVCSLPNRITDLSLLSVWTDANIPATDFARLVGPHVRRLHLSKLVVDGIGSAIVERIRAVNCPLEDAMLTIGTYHRLTVDQCNWYVHAMSRLCKSFRLRMHADVDPVPALMSVARRITECPNLTELYLDHIPQSRGEHESVAIMLENLPKLSFLRVLSLGGWVNPSMVRCLTYGVSQCYSLEQLALRSVPTTRFELLDEFFWKLPTTIHTLHLERIPSFYDEHLETICDRLPGLKSLRISGLPKLSPISVHDMFYYLPCLERFHSSVPLPVEVAKTLCDSLTLPNMKHVEFACTLSQPDAMLGLLRSFFTSVQRQSHHSNRRWSWIRVSDRIPSAAPYPDENIDLYPQPETSSKQPNVHKRKQPQQQKRQKKLEWESF